MTTWIASDIHGAYSELGKALHEDDILILCGDYLRFLDYDTLDGILAELLPKDMITSTLQAIRRGDLDEVKRFVAGLFSDRQNLMSRIREIADNAYRKMFSLIPCETYLVYGNVDVPDLLVKNAGGHHHVMDGETAMIEGKIFGFVSGLPPTAYSFGMPGDVSERQFLLALDALGSVDVLITHCPPAVADLTYDVEAERDEEGSAGLLRYLEDFQPSLHFFGHVHNPRSRRHRIGRTLCVNTAYFSKHRVLYDYREIQNDNP